IVLVACPKLGKRFSNLCLLLDNKTFPDLSIRHFLLSLNRAVGVDGVAIVDEKIRPAATHGGVGAHTTTRLIDAPTLPRRVARPNERDGPLVARSGAETPNHRLAHDCRGE